MATSEDYQKEEKGVGIKSRTLISFTWVILKSLNASSQEFFSPSTTFQYFMLLVWPWIFIEVEKNFIFILRTRFIQSHNNKVLCILENHVIL